MTDTEFANYAVTKANVFGDIRWKSKVIFPRNKPESRRHLCCPLSKPKSHRAAQLLYLEVRSEQEKKNENVQMHDD